MKKTLKINDMDNVQPRRTVFSHAYVGACERERAPACAPAPMRVCT